jgi:hypothetical protein
MLLITNLAPVVGRGVSAKHSTAGVTLILQQNCVFGTIGTKWYEPRLGVGVRNMSLRTVTGRRWLVVAGGCGLHVLVQY